MEDERTNEEKIFDKVKALNMVSNAHNLNGLTPPQLSDLEENKITIIESLKSTPRLQALYLRLQGLQFDEDEKKIIRVSKPIMNSIGTYRLVEVLRDIAEETEYSNFAEDEIDSRINYHYQSNFPSFTFSCRDYELDPSDFNIISTILFSFIDASFHKAKGGAYMRLISKTYNEDMLGKIMKPGDDKNSGGFGSVLSKLNPFGKR